MAPSLLILAAGMGNRYERLKQLDPVGPGNEVIMEYSIYDALRHGFDEVIFVLRREFEEVFRKKVLRRVSRHVRTGLVLQDRNDLPPGFSASGDRNKPWGTGHAIWCARHALKKSFVAINADDFYGEDAFHNAALFFSQPGLEYTNFMMPGFQLAGTLSDHGPVSRAVCIVNQTGMLRGAEEHSSVEKRPEGIVSFTGDTVVKRFKGTEIVSLNFWGLTPCLFPLLEKSFCSFLSKNLSATGGEFYISRAISEMLFRSEVTVSVFPTDNQWYGVTYKEDKFPMVRAIANFVRSGRYPATLWR
ncbi:MAG: nucleotidyltransferase [Candidatus Xiphinematobacter sp.]|nr:MAG: nucleotidyltransferase [Candidatus Xiphinematobacter sp.]